MLEAWLQQIRTDISAAKGAGWSGETLKALMDKLNSLSLLSAKEKARIGATGPTRLFDYFDNINDAVPSSDHWTVVKVGSGDAKVKQWSAGDRSSDSALSLTSSSSGDSVLVKTQGKHYWTLYGKDVSTIHLRTRVVIGGLGSYAFGFCLGNADIAYGHLDGLYGHATVSVRPDRKVFITSNTLAGTEHIANIASYVEPSTEHLYEIVLSKTNSKLYIDDSLVVDDTIKPSNVPVMAAFGTGYYTAGTQMYVAYVEVWCE